MNSFMHVILLIGLGLAVGVGFGSWLADHPQATTTWFERAK